VFGRNSAHYRFHFALQLAKPEKYIELLGREIANAQDYLEFVKLWFDEEAGEDTPPPPPPPLSDAAQDEVPPPPTMLASDDTQSSPDIEDVEPVTVSNGDEVMGEQVETVSGASDNDIDEQSEDDSGDDEMTPRQQWLAAKAAHKETVDTLNLEIKNSNVKKREAAAQWKAHIDNLKTQLSEIKEATPKKADFE